MRRSKTDPDGLGHLLGIPKAKRKASCPVHAVGEWLSRAGIDSGPIFREVDRHSRVGESALTGSSVARIVKRTVAAAGMSLERFAGHSLRAGLATCAAQAGKVERKIMDQTRHKSVAMVRRTSGTARCSGTTRPCDGFSGCPDMTVHLAPCDGSYDDVLRLLGAPRSAIPGEETRAKPSRRARR